MKTKEEWLELINQLSDGANVAIVDKRLGNFYSGDEVDVTFCTEDNIFYLDIGEGIIAQCGTMVKDEYPEEDNVITIY